MKKWQIIDLVRSFSILVVLADHAYTNPPFSRPWMSWLWGRFSVNGGYGVILFFVVSGFLITHVIAARPGGLFKPDLYNFYVHRIGRIWPLFFLVVSIGVIVYWAHIPYLYECFFPGNHYGFWFWLSVPTFMMNWYITAFPFYPMGLPWGVEWSLSIEEQFYLLYPFALKKLGNEKNLAAGIIALILLAILSRWLLGHYWPNHPYIQLFPSFVGFDLIGIGILLFLAVRRYGSFFSRNRPWSWGVCLAGLGLLLGTYFGTNTNLKGLGAFIPEGLGFGLFAFLLGGLHLDFFESRFLRLLCLPGKYCFGCYLWHPIVIMYVRPYFSQLNFFLYFLIFAFLTTVIGGISFHFLEVPMNQLIRKKWGHPTPLPPRKKLGNPRWKTLK